MLRAHKVAEIYMAMTLGHLPHASQTWNRRSHNLSDLKGSTDRDSGQLGSDLLIDLRLRSRWSPSAKLSTLKGEHILAGDPGRSQMSHSKGV